MGRTELKSTKKPHYLSKLCSSSLQAMTKCSCIIIFIIDNAIMVETKR